MNCTLQCDQIVGGTTRYRVNIIKELPAHESSVVQSSHVPSVSLYGIVPSQQILGTKTCKTLWRNLFSQGIINMRFIRLRKPAGMFDPSFSKCSFT